MKVSYDWLQTYFKKGLFGGGLPRPAKLAELLSAHAFEVEGAERVSGDIVLDVKVLPDRAHYALSHAGIAGEVSAIARIPLRSATSKSLTVSTAIAKPRVTITDSSLCPRYMARRIEGIAIGVAPKYVRQHLEAIGQRSINSIVDATNYVMYGVGQPLHAFDADQVQGGIVVRLAAAGEHMTTLDGRDIALLASDIVIADDAGVLAIAGVKGGKRAEVTAATKNLIIESANFHATSVRRTSTRTNLRSDSSKRFENEISPVLTEAGMCEVTELILESSLTAQIGEIVDVYPKPAAPWTISVDTAYMNAVTGLDLSVADMTDILTRLDCKVEAKGGQTLSVTPHWSRLDLRIPEDIADELARIYGYDKLVARDMPDIPRVPIDKTFYWAEKVKDVLVAQGFSEIQTYTLVSKGDFEVTYPLASDKSALRKIIGQKLSESLTSNTLNADLLGLDVLKVFEIGKVFIQDGEKTSLCIGVSVARKKKGVTFDGLIKVIEGVLANELNISPDEVHGSGQFNSQNGFVEIDFDALVAKLPTPGSFADLDIKPLSRDIRYKPFSHFPFITRDIALFVPSTTTEEEVSGVIKIALTKAAGTLLVKGPDCFDRFEKEGRKSLAFRMIFQSFDRTLSDDEVNPFMQSLYAVVKARGWEVR